MHVLMYACIYIYIQKNTIDITASAMKVITTAYWFVVYVGW